MSILKDETGCKVKNNNSITVKLMFTFFTKIIYNCKDVWNTCAILLNVWIKFSVPDVMILLIIFLAHEIMYQNANIYGRLNYWNECILKLIIIMMCFCGNV